MEQKISTTMADFDISTTHILKVTIKPVDPTLEEVNEYITTITNILEENNEPLIGLIDGSNAKWISGKARIEMGKGLKKIGMKYKDMLKKNMFVAPNPVTKMMLKAINIVIKPQIPQEVFSDYKTALIATENEITNL